MEDKLRARLGKSKGFTLVELLVVIAIIAILVLLVIIALNPIERIRDANDRNAQNAVRQAGSAVMSCITKELATGGTPWAAGFCDNEAAGGFLEAQGYIQSAASLAGVAVAVNAAGTSICASVPNAGGHLGQVTWNSDDTLVSNPDVATGVCNP